MDSLIKGLIDSGALTAAVLLVGIVALAGITGLVARILWKAVRSCQDAVLAIATRSASVIEQSVASNDVLKDGIDSRNRSAEALAAAVAAQAQELRSLRETIDRANDASRERFEQLLRLFDRRSA